MYYMMPQADKLLNLMTCEVQTLSATCHQGFRDILALSAKSGGPRDELGECRVQSVPKGSKREQCDKF